jgi:hypothetical protein
MAGPTEDAGSRFESTGRYRNRRCVPESCDRLAVAKCDLSFDY